MIREVLLATGSRSFRIITVHRIRIELVTSSQLSLRTLIAGIAMGKGSLDFRAVVMADIHECSSTSEYQMRMACLAGVVGCLELEHAPRCLGKNTRRNMETMRISTMMPSGQKKYHCLPSLIIAAPGSYDQYHVWQLYCSG